MEESKDTEVRKGIINHTYISLSGDDTLKENILVHKDEVNLWDTLVKS